MTDAFRPSTTNEAIEYRATTGALPFSGGTDLMVRHRGYSGTLPAISGPILFLDAIEELHRIEVTQETITIGAAATLSEILAESDLPELLRRAIETIAAPALRNRATLAGNICNASPAADSLPPLYVHDAEVILRGVKGERISAIRDFITGPGSTTLDDDEVVTAVRIPLLREGRGYYRKVGTRRANALSKLSAAGFARVGGATTRGTAVGAPAEVGGGSATIRGTAVGAPAEVGSGGTAALSDVRFALGAVAPTVVRLTEVEDALEGVPLAAIPERVAALRALALPYIRPINDQRSTAEYRTSVALNALEEFLLSLTEDR